MAIKNTRTSVKKETEDTRLRKKLKEDYDNFLHEEDDELPDEMGDDDMGDDMTAEGGDEISGMGDDDMGMGDEDMMGGEGDGLETSPEETEWMDKELDSLLATNKVDDSGDLDEGEELEETRRGEAAMFGKNRIAEEDGDLGIEDDNIGLGGEGDGFGYEVDHGDSVFSADELNGIIHSGDSVHELESELKTKGDNMSPEELQSSMTDIDEPFHDVSEDEFGEDDIDGAGFEDEFGDEEMGENEFTDDVSLEEDMMEAEHVSDGGVKGGAKTNVTTYNGKDPMTGIRGEDQGNFDQGYEGDHVKDELMEADVMKALGFTEDEPDLEGKGKYGKVATNAKKGNIGTEKNLGDKFDKVSDTVKESIKKSKMLIKAATAIVKLQEALKNQKIQNYKLIKANGVLAAIGDKLSKDTRRKVSESFSKCKTSNDVNALYEKVVKAVRKNTPAKPTGKNPQPKKPLVKEAPKKTVPVASNGKTLAENKALNQIVQKTKTAPTTIANKTEVKKQVEQIKESIQTGTGTPGVKVKKELSEAQKRINFLSGIPGSDDMYYSMD